MRGRPRVREKKDNVVYVRVSEAELMTLQELAEREDRSVSSIIRKGVFNYYKPSKNKKNGGKVLDVSDDAI